MNSGCSLRSPTPRHVTWMCCFRVNLPDPAPAGLMPDAGAPPGTGMLVMGGRPAPFGMDPGALDYCGVLLPGLRRLRLRGVHAHLASGLDAAALLRVAGNVITFAREWGAQRGIPIAEINVGGGMRADYRRPCDHFDWLAYGRGLGRLARAGSGWGIGRGRRYASSRAVR